MPDEKTALRAAVTAHRRYEKAKADLDAATEAREDAFLAAQEAGVGNAVVAARTDLSVSYVSNLVNRARARKGVRA